MKFIIEIADKLLEAAKKEGAANILIAAGHVLQNPDWWNYGSRTYEVEVVSTFEWYKKDEAFLKKNWSKMPTAEIAWQLGRSEASVVSKAYRIGLEIRNKFKSPKPPKPPPERVTVPSQFHQPGNLS